MTAHVERQHAIRIGHPVERVFPLFTPAGEERWIESWRPYYLWPPGRETREGMVFRTGADDDATLWSRVLWRPDEYRARYVRVTPASRFGFVDVACRALDQGSAEATIGYAITALNDRGAAYLDGFTADAFGAMIEDWRIAIERTLAEVA